MTAGSSQRQPESPRVVGVILAGGQGRRLGGRDKALVEIAGAPLVDHVVGRLRAQVDGLAISANGDPSRFRSWGYPVVGDVDHEPDGASIGPLAGVLAGLEWAARLTPRPAWVATVPVDGPLIPNDLVHRLVNAATEQQVPVACAASRGRLHPVSAAWSVACLDRLRAQVARSGVRSAQRASSDLGRTVVDWSVGGTDPFLNINEPEDVDTAARILRAHS